MSGPAADRPRRGAYGFALRGVEGAEDLLAPAPTQWSVLGLEWEREEAPRPLADTVGDRWAELRLRSGGSVFVDHRASRAVYRLPAEPRAGEMIHPHLAPAAAIMSHWLERDSFHAGAFVAGDGAWAVLGDKESGKSSLLAFLALEGHPVVTDDLLVLDGAMALAGPRSLDLREPSARWLGAGEPLGRVGLRERWRLRLDALEPTVALRGFVVLRWHDGDPALRALRGAERLKALLPHRAVRLPSTDAARLVSLSALGFYELRRPRDWGRLSATSDLLLEALSPSR